MICSFEWAYLSFSVSLSTKCLLLNAYFLIFLKKTRITDEITNISAIEATANVVGKGSGSGEGVEIKVCSF